MNTSVSLRVPAVAPSSGSRPHRQELRERAIVRIHLLGPMQATTYLGQNILPHGKRARAILGFLCLAAGEHVARAELRTTALLARPEIEYVLVFENRGREVGATIDHPHGQIYGYPFVPPAPAREVESSDGCAVCRDLTAELRAGERIVAEHGDWVAWVPFASGYAYGMRFAPRRHVPSLAALDDAGRNDLARLLIDALGRYDRLWPEARGADRFPYLLWFHQAPASGGEAWHVHAHVAPPLRAPGVPRYVASGELGSGTLSNPVVPEDAARALRDA